MDETKSVWVKWSDSAAQAKKTVVSRTQELAQKLDSGVRKEALDDVRKAREVVRKADVGLSHLLDRIEHWAQTEPKAAVRAAPKEPMAPEAAKKTAKVHGAPSQPS